MQDERILRKNGDRLCLENREYEIAGTQGQGGSSIVYRAFYRDSLIEGRKHWVLIKELYPCTRDFSVVRNDQGVIVWRDSGEQQRSMGRFLQGNEVNLELLEDHPAQISGNLVNCHAYGTYYSVLPLHGGEILQKRLETGAGPGLREAAVILKQILEGLRPFHDRRLLYLDISPDNILVFRGWALLIDFDSVWSMDQLSQESGSFSKKSGYTAPEICVPEERDSIGFATDLYSVCAVFFELLTGKRPDEVCGLLSEAAIFRSLEKCPVFQGEPLTAFLKTAEILIKGLDASARGRYQSISQLAEQLDELILRIDHKGVSHSALWECSRTAWERPAADPLDYIGQDIEIVSSNEPGKMANRNISAKELFAQLVNGADILLNGPGGMGKTRLLSELAEVCTQQYDPELPVFFYIGLGEYQGENKGEGYIRKQLMRYLNFSGQSGTMDDMTHELDRLLDQRLDGRVNLVLMLDGLNEAQESGKNLLPEIEELSRKSGVSILVTDRSDEVLQYALSGFKSAVLKPLNSRAVQAALDAGHVKSPEALPLRELLRNPMMLELYIRVSGFEREGVGKQTEKEAVLTADDLVRLYLERQLIFLQRRHHGTKDGQLRDAYILTHVLPAVAKKMGSSYRISGTGLAGAVQKSYERLKQAQFVERFPEYRDSADQLLAGWTKERWYGYVVNQLLSLALLCKCGEDSYRLFHDNIKSCLVKMAGENDKKMGVTAAELKETAAGWGEFLAAAYGVASFACDLYGIFVEEKKKKARASGPETAGYNGISYFLYMTEVYGIPVGIHPLKAGDLNCVNTYLEFRTSGDGGEDLQISVIQKGREKRGAFSTADENPVQTFRLQGCGIYDGKRAAKTIEVSRGDVCHQQQYDGGFTLTERGLSRICTLLRDGAPATIEELGLRPLLYQSRDVFRIKEYYDGRGYIKYTMYLEGGSGETCAVDMAGVAGVECFYDKQGRRVGMYFVDAHVERIAVDGVYVLVFRYDERDDLTMIGWLDQDNNLTDGRGGWACCRQIYDSFHNVIKTEYYDRNLKPVSGPEGAFRIQMTYIKGCIV